MAKSRRSVETSPIKSLHKLSEVQRLQREVRDLKDAKCWMQRALGLKEKSVEKLELEVRRLKGVHQAKEKTTRSAGVQVVGCDEPFAVEDSVERIWTRWTLPAEEILGASTQLSVESHSEAVLQMPRTANVAVQATAKWLQTGCQTDEVLTRSPRFVSQMPVAIPMSKTLLTLQILEGVDIWSSPRQFKSTQTVASRTRMASANYCLVDRGARPWAVSAPRALTIEPKPTPQITRNAVEILIQADNDKENRKLGLCRTVVFVPQETDMCLLDSLIDAAAAVAPGSVSKIQALRPNPDRYKLEAVALIEKALFEFNWKSLAHPAKISHVMELKVDLAQSHKENAALRNKLRRK
ncbi:MAG: uncharacterized protein KVP18_004347 [Porospora cf. gigantea A]|uniref:uncharacterized protein n=1 Tax=Porospora cf. gigantea A TaxID=2853593 RepID=UPI003559E2A4|nr:MAG: hypothetical protein KVP18_004347 [Porospora cf. gigantea A]